MGCCYSNLIVGETKLELSINSAEVDLGLWTFESKYLDRLAHRNSTDKYMTKTQFSRFFAVLGITEKENLLKNFYLEFYNHKLGIYNTKKISTLGILLGTADSLEKIHLLFQNYDSHQSNSLKKQKIKNIITDIFDIACLSLPSLALKQQQPGEVKEELEKYISEMRKFKFIACNHFIKQIFDDFSGDEMTIDQFKTGINSYSLVGIVNVRKFRKIIREIYEFLQRLSGPINAYLNGEEDYKDKAMMFGIEIESLKNEVE